MTSTRIRVHIICLICLLLAGLVGCGGESGEGGNGKPHEHNRPDIPFGTELSDVEGVSIIRLRGDSWDSSSVWSVGDEPVMEAEAAPLRDVLKHLIEHWHDFEGWSFQNADLPDGRFNVRIEVPRDKPRWPFVKRAFEQALNIRFVQRQEMLDVLALQKAEGQPRGLTRVDADSSNWGTADTPDGFGCEFRAATMEDLARYLAQYFEDPIEDETGLTGYYRFTLSMDHWEPETVEPGIEKLGLKLVRVKRRLNVIRIVNADSPLAGAEPRQPTTANE